MESINKTQFVTVGKGIYTLTEAQRLTDIPRQRIVRWTRGYSYEHRGVRHELPPIIGRELDPSVGQIITFADLIEMRFLNEFRRHGVSAKAVRVASERAQEFIGRLHPFSTSIFRTDGITILAEVSKESGDKVLLDLVKNQYGFERVISPYLYAELDFNRLKEPERWWPLGRHRSVVIDPQRSFGAPIAAGSRVPTTVLSRAAKAQGSVEDVAKLFRITVQEVQDAVEFETKLAA